MFHLGFSKLATAVVTLSPERYYELAREKDPYVGSLAGAAAGAAAGGAKKKSAKGALIGAGVGAVSGAVGGSVISKGLKHYQSHRIERLAKELRLRATPARIKPHDGD